MKNTVPISNMVWFAGLSMLGFLATDMYLPAFEQIRATFDTQESTIGLTLTIFLLGMALGQLIYGPLSDRIGRIKVLTTGMVLFIFASALSAISPNVEILLIARFLQALGACSATVIWQAIVIDRYEGKTSQRIFATIMPLVALSPALAPLAGAALESQFGWRSIFVALILLGLVLVASTLRQEESAPLNGNEGNLLPKLLNNYKHILSSRKFIANMLIFSGCSAAFFAWLTGTPFIMTQMGYDGADIGLSFIPQTIAFIIGGYACRILLNKHDGNRLLPRFIALFITSISVIFFLSTQLALTSIIPVLIPFCFLAISNGAVYPIVVNKALENFKQCSATAAGLLNFIQTLICFVASGVVSFFSPYGLTAVSCVMLIAALCVGAGWFLIYIDKKKHSKESLSIA